MVVAGGATGLFMCGTVALGEAGYSVGSMPPPTSPRRTRGDLAARGALPGTWPPDFKRVRRFLPLAVPACPIPPVRTTPRLASTVNTVRRRARVILLIRGGGSGSPFTVGALAVATGDRALPSAAVWLPGHDAAQQIVRLFDGCRAAPLCRH